MADVAGPLVSVILPTFNRLGYLSDAIHSVTRQTYSNWELIVVDDGSTDRTRDYLTSLSDHRIQIVLIEHCGNIASVRNIGIRKSTGGLIVFLDSDDLLLPQTLSWHALRLETHPECGWSYGHHQLVDAGGKVIGSRFEGPNNDSADSVLRDVLTDRSVPCTGAVMIRREIFEVVGYFDETLRLAEDFDLWIRLAFHVPAVLVDETLVQVRQHDDRTTAGVPAMAKSKARVYEKAKEMMVDENLGLLCDRMRGEQLIRHAAGLSRRQAPLQALRMLAVAAPLSGWTSSWWRELAKVLMRPVLRR